MENHSFDNYLGVLGRGDRLAARPRRHPDVTNPTADGRGRRAHDLSTTKQHRASRPRLGRTPRAMGEREQRRLRPQRRTPASRRGSRRGDGLLGPKRPALLLRPRPDVSRSRTGGSRLASARRSRTGGSWWRGRPTGSRRPADPHASTDPPTARCSTCSPATGSAGPTTTPIAPRRAQRSNAGSACTDSAPPVAQAVVEGLWPASTRRSRREVVPAVHGRRLSARHPPLHRSRAFHRTVRRRATPGALPRVSIVDPDFHESSEENPQDIRYGEAFAARIINAVHVGRGMVPHVADLGVRRARWRGRVALLTGGRVKIGYQAGLKLLRCGAHLIVTTRFPRDSASRYSQEPDFAEWSDRLEIYGLDLRHTPSIETFCQELLATKSRLDFIINNACQTVRRPPDFYAHMMAGEASAAGRLSEPMRRLLTGDEALRSAHGHDVSEALTVSERGIPMAQAFAFPDVVTGPAGGGCRSGNDPRGGLFRTQASLPAESPAGCWPAT